MDSPDPPVRKTFEPQPGSRLLTLPAEIRNKIYSFVYDEEEVVDNFYGDSGDYLPPNRHDGRLVLLTCRQIRYEATAMAWENRVFWFPGPRVGTAQEGFAALSPDLARHVQTLQVFVDCRRVVWEEFDMDWLRKTFQLTRLPLKELTIDCLLDKEVSLELSPLHPFLVCILSDCFLEIMELFVTNPWLRGFRPKPPIQERAEPFFSNCRTKRTVFRAFSDNGRAADFLTRSLFQILTFRPTGKNFPKHIINLDDHDVYRRTITNQKWTYAFRRFDWRRPLSKRETKDKSNKNLLVPMMYIVRMDEGEDFESATRWPQWALSHCTK